MCGCNTFCMIKVRTHEQKPVHMCVIVLLYTPPLAGVDHTWPQMTMHRGKKRHQLLYYYYGFGYLTHSRTNWMWAIGYENMATKYGQILVYSLVNIFIYFLKKICIANFDFSLSFGQNVPMCGCVRTMTMWFSIQS